jgi:hypothetical protein
MEKYPFIGKLGLNSYEGSSLSRFIENVELGNEVPLRSSFANSLSVNSILAGWDKIFNSKLNCINPTLLTIEMDNRDKIGPRSLANGWVIRKSGVNEYFSSSDLPRVPERIIPSQHLRLRPLSLETASTYLKSNTNSGLPYLTRKSNCKAKVLSDFNRLLGRKDPCVLFTRTQEQRKTRNVWGFPIADTLNEMRFYRPLLEYQRLLSWRSALRSPDEVDKSITRIMNINSGSNFLVSIDFSAFDASVKSQLQFYAFEYIKYLFQNQYHSDIDYIRERFNSIGLVTPDGILNGKHGVPSGSTFTNEVDSIVQFICARSFNLNESEMDIQGDDGVYITPKPDSLLNHFSEFGLSVNKKKSHISKDECIYLQNLYSRDYSRDGIVRGVYSTYRALNRILHPERYDKYSVDEITGADYNSIRAISIIENCRYHPLFEEFVKFIYTLDKYDLRYSQQGLSSYIKRIRNTEGAEGIFNYRRGDELKGIARFHTVQLLSKL